MNVLIRPRARWGGRRCSGLGGVVRGGSGYRTVPRHAQVDGATPPGLPPPKASGAEVQACAISAPQTSARASSPDSCRHTKLLLFGSFGQGLKWRKGGGAIGSGAPLKPPTCREEVIFTRYEVRPLCYLT